MTITITSSAKVGDFEPVSYWKTNPRIGEKLKNCSGLRVNWVG